MNDSSEKVQPDRLIGRDKPRRMHARGSQLGIHILVVAYRNTTHYSIKVP